MENKIQQIQKQIIELQQLVRNNQETSQRNKGVATKLTMKKC